MDKHDVRSFIAELEECLDHSLRKWKKVSSVENGVILHRVWQFELSFIFLELNWANGSELICLNCHMPDRHLDYYWQGFNNDNIDNVLDRACNFAQRAEWKPELYDSEHGEKETT